MGTGKKECFVVGEVLTTTAPVRDIDRKVFSGWQTPLAGWGIHKDLASGMAAVKEEGRTVLAFTDEICKRTSDRALATGSYRMRDCSIEAEVLPIDVAAEPNSDNKLCREALVGIVFRMQTSRRYYQFGIEGRRRVVLYRRIDDEWKLLAEQGVFIPTRPERCLYPDAYLLLQVDVNGDEMRCRCTELGVDFNVTDSMIATGKAGIRSLKKAHLGRIRISQTPVQQARNQLDWSRIRLPGSVLPEIEMETAPETPDAVEHKVFDSNELGGNPVFMDFAERGRYDMLISGGSPVRPVFRACTVDGEILWELPEAVINFVFSRSYMDGSRLIYGFTGKIQSGTKQFGATDKMTLTSGNEMVVIRGSDGEILAREAVPSIPEVAESLSFYSLTFSPTTGTLVDNDGVDIVLREMRPDIPAFGGLNVWAYDRNLKLLWHHEQVRNKAHYGHQNALAFFDIDGDGRDELLAGGTMYSADGKVLWKHDRAEEVRAWKTGEHYDAVAVGNFSGFRDTDPVAFLCGSSAGLYVVDARTGETRSAHRIGHAQACTVARFRDDLPGEQVLVANHHGSNGIWNLFSGAGDRPWSTHVDSVYLYPTAVRWGDSPFPLIWASGSAEGQAFYDGYGRLARRLPAISRLHEGKRQTEVVKSVVRLGRSEIEYLAVATDGKVYFFGPG